MSPKQMTAKQKHRAEAFDIARGDDGMVRCVLRSNPNHECGGRLQAHHVIAAQRLAKLHDRANDDTRLLVDGGPRWAQAMRECDIWDLISDGRNSEVTCEVGHRQIEKRRFTPEATDPLIAFATDYGLEHLLLERTA
jgi:hypothetical protein